MKLSAILAPLLAAKVPADVIMDTVRAFEAEQEAQLAASREKQKARWDRWREGEKGVAARGSKRLQTLAAVGNNSHAGDTRGLDNLQTKSLTGKEDKVDVSPPARPQRGRRLPDDFEPDIVFASAEGMTTAEAKSEAASFLDYWRSQPGSKGLKLDWMATWRVWVRNALKRRPPARSPPQEPIRKPRNPGERLLQKHMNGTTHEPSSPSSGRLEISYGPGQGGGSGIPRQFAQQAGPQRRN